MIILKTDEEIAIMAKAGRIARECLLRIGEMIKPGVRTVELDRAAEDFIRSRGALPTFKGLYGFPAVASRMK